MVKTVLHDVLETGVGEGASDWHIREDSTVSFRANGELGEIDYVTDREFMEKLIEQILPPAQQNEFKRSGDADFAFQEEGVGRFRANLHWQRGKYALALRYVQQKVPSLKKLRLPAIILKIAESQRGIVFLAGITGAGKTTTQACMLQHMNKNMTRHIITIEDPVEYTFIDENSVIEQRDVGLDVDTFESALKHVLRQDPDVIVLGEMRDRHSFETALMAAETGHLVLCTLHTLNAPQSLLRVLDMFPEYERDSVRKSLAGNLRAVICQRLLRRASGNGLVPCVEILINNSVARKLITEGKIGKLEGVIESGTSDNMISFNNSLLNLVNEGLISEEEALKASTNPEQLRMNLQGIFLNSDGGKIIGG